MALPAGSVTRGLVRSQSSCCCRAQNSLSEVDYTVLTEQHSLGRRADPASILLYPDPQLVAPASRRRPLASPPSPFWSPSSASFLPPLPYMYCRAPARRGLSLRRRLPSHCPCLRADVNSSFVFFALRLRGRVTGGER
jgi:hypothetical protein